MRYGVTILALILGGFAFLELARHIYWVMELFAVVGILTVFGGGTWLAATRWDNANKAAFEKRMQDLREPPDDKPGYFDR